MECCDLDDCDFWQCCITEYESKDDFIIDTHPKEQFRSLKTDFEKGCLIQLFPIDKAYPDILEDSTYIYPPRIDMSPTDCFEWINNVTHIVNETKTHIIDKIIWWRLDNSNCTLIKRDPVWFNKSLPILKQMWDYVLFFRLHPNKFVLLQNYMNTMGIKYNEKIMKCIDLIYKGNDGEVLININQNKHKTRLIEKEKEAVVSSVNNSEYMFDRSDDENKKVPVNNAKVAKVAKVPVNNSKVAKVAKVAKVQKVQKPATYMFDD